MSKTRSETAPAFKAPRDTWEEVRYQLVETGWFDWENRPKTLKAVKFVTERISDEELDCLTERIKIILARAPGTSGEVMPFGGAWTPPIIEYTVLVYLAPELERFSQRRVNSVVVHEFAHALLHNFDEPAPSDLEEQADEKIATWGFGPAYKREGRHR